MTIAAVHWGEGGVEVDISANILRVNHYYNAQQVRRKLEQHCLK